MAKKQPQIGRKPGSGGARPGAGVKSGPSEALTVRVKKDLIARLREKYGQNLRPVILAKIKELDD